ncbi:MAG: hypothetical protein ABWX96_19845 [Propionibacteriaceae bacterium]
MSFASTLRALGRTHQPVERAMAAASTRKMRDELIVAATAKAGNPPRV